MDLQAATAHENSISVVKMSIERLPVSLLTFDHLFY
jgi:hypothetical protein